MTTEVYMPTTPDLPGAYFHKLKHQPSAYGSWTTRFFKLNADKGTLEYYKLDPAFKDDAVPLRSLDLLKVTSVRDFDNATFQISASPDVFLLRSDDKAIQKKWVDVLTKYIKDRSDFFTYLSKEKAKTKPIPPALNTTFYKLKHKESSFGNFVLRNFRVDKAKETLAYYNDSSSQRAKKSFPLTDLVGVRVFDKNTIVIQTTTVSFLLRAKSAEEQNVWFMALDTYITDQKEYDTWQAAVDSLKTR